MKLTLERFAYTPTETQGVLTAGNNRFYTIEKPWVQGPFIGGASFESCVPDGFYDLETHTRPDGTKTMALVNPSLGVWHHKWDRPWNWGRYDCVFHSANFVHEVNGCVAPGLFRGIYWNKIMVTNSRAAMNKLSIRDYNLLEIVNFTGAVDEDVRI